ncbi:hypothetical protein GIB67_030859 [Kingdonia uniflora]|uniref:Uncharacterized protein n=1 Tax=Kingdonia uniflora TaxID=39325 RepID=A0A7J7L3A0_9MAGN|nr:hypothetical protein GIB67_030859 [Kingdonia uniflora]
MEPNPSKFPILSYVLSRTPNKPTSINASSLSSASSSSLDIENQYQSTNPNAPKSNLNASELALVSQMPHLKHPKVLASMNQSISSVAQTRSVIETLGDRPNRETVDTAKNKIVGIESRLSKELQEIVLAKRPEVVERAKFRAVQAAKERECREKAEKEKMMYKAVVQLDKMHVAYEKVLSDARSQLVKIYESFVTRGKGLAEEENGYCPADEEVREEVVGLLQEMSGTGVERLDLSGQQLRCISEAFGRIHGLVVLNLANNRLEVIPDSIAGLGSLQELYLSSNLLEALPDSIGLLHNLKVLDVSSNKLRSLPDSISHCRSLVELNASFNRLTYLPTNIGYELVNLRILYVHLNKIRSLPTSVCEMRNLRYLDVHFNQLCGLPHAVGRLTNLEILNLSKNFSDLKELPHTIGDLTNLRELDLSNNQICVLPDTFGRLESLIKLNLDQNPLLVPPMEIVSEGVEAIKEFMLKRWVDILVVEEEKSILEVSNQSRTGWFTRSTLLLKNMVSVVSENVKGYTGTGETNPRDAYLNHQL